MIDPRLELAFENAVAKLKDSNGNPPTKERVESMKKKFIGFKINGCPDDLAFVQSIGGGWRC